MRGVIGILNSSVYVGLSIPTGPESNKSHLIKGSNSLDRGYFSVIPETSWDKTHIKYTDIVNIIDVFVTEDKTYPLVKIYCNLPMPDTLACSTFFMEGHFKFDVVNVTSKKKTVAGERINEHIRIKKKVNLLDKLFIEYLGEPLHHARVIKTSLGDITMLRTQSIIEI